MKKKKWIKILTSKLSILSTHSTLHKLLPPTSLLTKAECFLSRKELCWLRWKELGVITCMGHHQDMRRPILPSWGLTFPRRSGRPSLMRWMSGSRSIGHANFHSSLRIHAVYCRALWAYFCQKSVSMMWSSSYNMFWKGGMKAGIQEGFSLIGNGRCFRVIWRSVWGRVWQGRVRMLKKEIKWRWIWWPVRTPIEENLYQSFWK